MNRRAIAIVGVLVFCIGSLSRATMTANQTLVALADELKRGDLKAAARRFEPDPSNQDVIMHLDAQKRERLASGFGGAKLKESNNGILTYESFWVEDDGSKTPAEFSLYLDKNGNWLITNW